MRDVKNRSDTVTNRDGTGLDPEKQDDPVQTVGNRDNTGLFRHKPGLHRDSTRVNQDATGANRL